MAKIVASRDVISASKKPLDLEEREEWRQRAEKERQSGPGRARRIDLIDLTDIPELLALLKEQTGSIWMIGLQPRIHRECACTSGQVYPRQLFVNLISVGSTHRNNVAYDLCENWFKHRLPMNLNGPCEEGCRDKVALQLNLICQTEEEVFEALAQNLGISPELLKNKE